MKFRLFGTKIEISFLFLAFLCFIIFTDKSGLIIPMIIAVVLHETAHLLCMRVFGCQPKAIRLIPASVSVIRDFCSAPKKEMLISLSGPFINVFMFVVFYRINIEFSIINLLIGCFNLLPFKGLDGGEIIHKALSVKVGEERADRILNLINFVAGAVGIFMGIFLIINKTPNISVIIISIYFLLSVIVKF